MEKTQPRAWALFLLLAGTSVIVGDLLIQHGRPDWYKVGLGALFLGMISVSHQLDRQALARRQRGPTRAGSTARGRRGQRRSGSHHSRGAGCGRPPG